MVLNLLEIFLKKIMKDRDITINYVDVQDHHKLGKIDRFYTHFEGEN